MDKKIILFAISFLFVAIIFSSGCVKSNTHNECSDGLCVMVQGSGEDQCGQDSDCEGNTPLNHYVCSGEKCIQVTGSGANECTQNADCAEFEEETHMECNADEQCVEVDGEGTNECTENADCVTEEEVQESLCSGTEHQGGISGEYFSGTCENECDANDYFYNSGDSVCNWGYLGHGVNGDYGDSCIWDNRGSCPSEEQCTSEGCLNECDGTFYTSRPSGSGFSGTCSNDCDENDYFYNSGDGLCYWEYIGHGVNGDYGDSCLWSNSAICSSAEDCTAEGCTS